MSNCGNCRKPARPTDPIVHCLGCNGTLHAACLGVPASTVHMVPSKPSSKIYCLKCASQEIKLDQLTKLVMEMKTDFTDRLTALEKQVCESPVASSSPAQKEEVIRETLQRFKRATNIIIKGIQENCDKNDESAVSEILEAVSGQEQPVDLKIVKVKRLGRAPVKNYKPRPIKVQFYSTEAANFVLRNKKSLSANPKFKRIAIDGDKTPGQLQYLRKVSKELNQWVDGGTNDVLTTVNNENQKD